MLRGPSRWVSWVAVVGVGAAVVATGAMTAHRAPAPQDAPRPIVTASSKADPRSCKPSAPVVVTLASTSRPGVWRVHLEALATVESAEITLGATAAGGDIARRVAWTGALSQGEERDLELTFAPPHGATNVWVEAAAGRGDAVQRGRAAIALRGGRPTATVEAAESSAGRLITDPATGEKTVEFVGSTKGAP